MKLRNTVSVAVILTLVATKSWGATPSQMTVQGKLTDALGAPKTGTFLLTFEIFSLQVGGTEIWPGVSSDGVFVTTDDEGTWTAQIGTVTALTDEVFSGAERWLQITVDDQVNPPETLTRIKLNTNPYAFRISTVDGATGGQISGSLFVGSGHSGTGANVFAAGQNNDVDGDCSSIGGGNNNSASGDSSFVGGGSSNRATAKYSVIVGGRDNAISSNDSGSVSGKEGQAIGGGRGNITIGAYSVIGGGRSNSIEGDSAAIHGGVANITTAKFSFIGGGRGNTISQSDSAAASGKEGQTLGGGRNNRVIGAYSVIGGGRSNLVVGDSAVVVGGFSNDAGGRLSAVLGGYNNGSPGELSVVLGGSLNSASGRYASIVGGTSNTADGENSFAAGNRAHADHDGSFVWAGDTVISNLSSQGRGHFVARAGRFWLGNLGMAVTYTTGRFIESINGAHLTSSGVWTNASSRELKEGFNPINRDELLRKLEQLPITEWHYKGDSAEVRHIGPVAEDFNAIFGVGADDKTITTIDPAGIALAAIQALMAQNRELAQRESELRGELRRQQAEINSLKNLLTR